MVVHAKLGAPAALIHLADLVLQAQNTFQKKLRTDLLRDECARLNFSVEISDNEISLEPGLL